MPIKRHKPEDIVAKLRQVDVLTSQGQNVVDAIRSIGVDVAPRFYPAMSRVGRFVSCSPSLDRLLAIFQDAPVRVGRVPLTDS